MNPGVIVLFLFVAYVIGAIATGVLLGRRCAKLAARTGQPFGRREARSLGFAAAFWPVGFFIASGLIEEEEDAQDRLESVIRRDTQSVSAPDEPKG